MISSRRWMLLVVAAPLALAACKKKPPVVAQQPQTPTTTPTTAPSNPTPTNTPTVDPNAARAAAVASARTALLDVITFEYDSDALTSDARARLDAKVRVLNANPQVTIRIEGHCDERGTDEYNLVLGRRRAEQAKRYLTDRGIDASRIETISFGRERPAVQGSDESAWAQNRRDEFRIASGDVTNPVS